MLFTALSSSSFHALRKSTLTFAAFTVASVVGGVSLCEQQQQKPTGPGLTSKEFRAFKVAKVERLSSNTKKVTFALSHKDQQMGLTVSSFVLARATIDGKPVLRPYTPVNLNEETGRIELVVKGYPEGKLSKHIVELKVGDSLEMKGPMTKLTLTPNKYKQISMIAGGSGLTPMLQMIKSILRNPNDQTQIVLIFANHSEQDILCRDELEALQYLYPRQFKLYHVLSQADQNWPGYTGHVSKSMLQELLPEPSDDNLVCVCGPTPMMYHVSGAKAKDYTQGELQGLLKELKFSSKNVFKL